VIIAFVWFWNGTQAGRMDRMRSDTVATVYGHHVSGTEVDREARKFYVALELGLVDLVQDLAGFDRNRAVENFVWNIMVIRREAKDLGIEPGDEEIKNTIASLRPLQTNGQFDPNKLNDLVQRSLTPRGFTETIIDDLVRDELRLKKVKALVSSGVELSPTELHSAYEQEHQKMEVSVIRFNTSDFAASVQISDDDAKKAFEQRQQQFKSEEQRKIKFVTFELSEADKKLTGKDRNAALEKLYNRANEFAQAMLDKNAKFDEIAAKSGAPVASTGAFTQASPDPQIAKVPALTSAAFQLTKDDPNSDVIQGENGFYVLQLMDVVPNHQLTFEEAKPKLIEQLKAERAGEALKLKASEVRTKLEADLKAGKSFADAAAAAGQKVDTIPPFSIADQPKEDVPDEQQILQKAVELGENQLSDVTQTEAGALLVYLNKRLPIDDKEFEKDKPLFRSLFVRQKSEAAFQEWLRTRREAAHVQIAQR